MMAFLQSWITAFGVFLASALACSLLEIFAAAEKQSWENRVRAVLFWGIFLAGVAVVVVPVQAIAHELGFRPLISLDLRESVEASNTLLAFAGYVLLPFLPGLLFDFFYYWFHRLQHSVPLLWRFHAVHHSIEELNAANCYHHVSEGLFRLPFIILPLLILIELKVPDVFIISATLAIWGQLVHANTRINFGPFGYLFVSPRYHRVHHSTNEAHYNKNFSSVFPVLDIVFGTAYFPRKEETLKTGLSDVQEPQTIKQYLFSLAKR